MNWQSLYDVKQAEIRRLASLTLSEVTPSIRSFVQYISTQKQELALIAGLKRTNPLTGRSWHECDLVALAQACDEAEVGVVAVYTEPSLFGTSLDDLRAISAAVSVPVLQLDLILHPNQIHQARLYGADAVLLHAGAVDRATLTTLVRVASSAHIAPVVAVQTRAELERALAAEALVLGLTSPAGTLDLAHLDTLVGLVPPQKATIVLDPIHSADEAATLHGQVDAVLVSEVVLDARDVGTALAGFTRLEGG
jgi:indole-3-glycerol phosphate synthase